MKTVSADYALPSTPSRSRGNEKRNNVPSKDTSLAAAGKKLSSNTPLETLQHFMPRAEDRPARAGPW